MLKEISNKNIRATTLKEFWGDEYGESIYLWEGAKHNLTLDEMENLQVATMSDLFPTEAEINLAHENCKKLYQKYLNILTKKLNEIHGLDLSASFWGTVFGYWLFRHICIVYEKYSYLSIIDINKTSIKLLDKDSFFIPYDHFEYVYCFCNDFGVQQLVSQYYYIFKNREYSCISKRFNVNSENNKFSIRRYLSLTKQILKQILENTIKNVAGANINPKVGLLNVFYTTNVLNLLTTKSKGEIRKIKLAKVNIKTSGLLINVEKRMKLLDIDVEDDFESFFIQTLYYSTPKLFIEHFRDYYKVFLEDIKSQHFTYLISEAWISDIPTSIYAAIARSEGVKLIAQEHAAMGHFLNKALNWIESENADFYLTTGWKEECLNIVSGGFCCRNITKYKFEPWKKNILFVSHTRFPYLIEFGGSNVSNSNYVKSLKIVRDFCDLLPDHLCENFVLRPHRGGEYFWDTEYTWEVGKNNITVDTGYFSRSVMQSKLVIIDHLTTGVAEILLNNIPLLIIHDNKVVPLSKKFRIFIDDLAECGVVHTSAQSAMAHLIKIYDDVPRWWNSDSVQSAVNSITSKTLAPSSRTVDYLLSCLPQ